MRLCKTIDTNNLQDGVYMVGPQEAAAMLARQKINRPKKENLVEELAGMIEAGHWLLTTDAIGFDEAGALINGQHRLSAIIKTGKSVPLRVATGLSMSAFDVIDTGRPRCGADVLAIAGYERSVRLSAVARFEIRYETRPIPGRIPPLLVLSKVEQLGDLAVNAVEFAASYASSLYGWLPLACFTWAYMHASAVGPNSADEWASKVATGADLREDDARFTLRRRLQNEAFGRTSRIISARKSDARCAYLLWRSWCMWREGISNPTSMLPKVVAPSELFDRIQWR